MTTSYFPQDDDWYEGDWSYDEPYAYAPAPNPVPFDIITLAAILLIILALVAGLSRVVINTRPAVSAPLQRQEQSAEEASPAPAAPPASLPGAEAFIMPYGDYILTQGPHGMSYGHYAIDLAAGKGEPILSPINGRVKQLYVDGIGNPTLVIENELYEVTMMHGIYDVVLGQEIQVSQEVGTESNQGNTRDMSGNSCRNRDCGYHTHLNVFDKRADSNVNPLDLLPKPYAN
jgi:murein DD-endopeptidase MepM/ murein hydrolase activator NlpD